SWTAKAQTPRMDSGLEGRIFDPSGLEQADYPPGVVEREAELVGDRQRPPAEGEQFLHAADRLLLRVTETATSDRTSTPRPVRLDTVDGVPVGVLPERLRLLGRLLALLATLP